MHVIQPPRLRRGNGGHRRALYFIFPITRRNDIQHESSADGLVDLRESRCLKVARLMPDRYIFAMDAMKTRARYSIRRQGSIGVYLYCSCLSEAGFEKRASPLKGKLLSLPRRYFTKGAQGGGCREGDAFTRWPWYY
jgi:hypothetical protein